MFGDSKSGNLNLLLLDRFGLWELGLEPIQKSVQQIVTVHKLNFHGLEHFISAFSFDAVSDKLSGFAL